VVETSLLQTGAYSLASDYSVALVDGKAPPRTPLAERPNVLYRPWRCKDGRWMLLMMLNPKPFWPGFCRALDRPEWIEDERFAPYSERMANAGVLKPLIEELFASRTQAEWAKRLDDHGLMWAPVQRLEEAVEDPQLSANGAFAELEHPELGSFRTVRAPFTLRGADVSPRGVAPELGEHSAEVLREVGLDAAEVGALFASGVVGPRAGS